MLAASPSLPGASACTNQQGNGLPAPPLPAGEMRQRTGRQGGQQRPEYWVIGRQGDQFAVVENSNGPVIGEPRRVEALDGANHAAGHLTSAADRAAGVAVILLSLFLFFFYKKSILLTAKKRGPPQPRSPAANPLWGAPAGRGSFGRDGMHRQ